MKALAVVLFTLLTSNLALAVTEHTPTNDGLGIGLILAVGIVCLVIARRKSA